MNNENNAKRDILLQAGISALPYIGGSLSALYFGCKQEKRFKRIEDFYSSLKERLANLEEGIIDLTKFDRSELASVVEEINEAIEKDFSEKKKTYLQNCFLNTINENQELEPDKKRYFISTILKLSELEISILVELYKKQDSAYRYDPDNSEFNGGLERLKSLGFVNAKMAGTITTNVTWGEITNHYISPFGIEFVEYCLISSE